MSRIDPTAGGREVIIPPASEGCDDAAGEWPMVMVPMIRQTGARALLLFSFFDSRGLPVDPPPVDASLQDFGGRMRLFLATDDDKVAFAETIVGGSQELYLGSSVGTDSVRFGDDTIGGGSTVASIGSLRVSETAARQVTGAYIVAAGGGDPYQYIVSRATGDESAVIRLDAGSSATTVEVTTDLRGLAFVDLDGVSVAGTMVVDVSVSEDSLVVATDLRAESTVGIFAGGGDPAEVRISGAVFADLTVTLGDGNDTLRLDLDESETSIRGFERIFDGGDGIDRLVNAPLGVWAVNFEL